MDVEPRKPRYFVAVVEALHFGRAADQLPTAQPVLSRRPGGAAVRRLRPDVYPK